MNQRIKFSCSNCGWTTSLVSAWTDLKPKKCPGLKCKTSFLKNPEKLLVELPKNEYTRTVSQEQKAEESSKRQSKKLRGDGEEEASKGN